MRQFFLTLALALCLAPFASHAQVRPVEGQGGNGGAGVNRNGRYMTFYSAGFYTEPNEATSDEVPQLPQLIQFFNTTQYMSELTKVKYLKSLIPTSGRKYFKVQPDTFTPEIRARLIAEYGRIMKIDTNTIALFAITDTTKNTTYLFPEFYSLKPSEQQAILFHETYWIVNPRATYDNVVQAEMSFQAYIEFPTSAERLLRWLHAAGTGGDTLVAAIRTDAASGAMNGLMKRMQIKMLDLFGAQYFDCRSRGLTGECSAFIMTNLYALTQKYPNSLFLKLFSDSLAQNKFSFQWQSNADTYDRWEEFSSYSNPNVSEWLKSLYVDMNSSGYSGASQLITQRITQPRKYRDDLKIGFTLVFR